MARIYVRFRTRRGHCDLLSHTDGVIEIGAMHIRTRTGLSSHDFNKTDLYRFKIIASTSRTRTPTNGGHSHRSSIRLIRQIRRAGLASDKSFIPRLDSAITPDPSQRSS